MSAHTRRRKTSKAREEDAPILRKPSAASLVCGS